MINAKALLTTGLAGVLLVATIGVASQVPAAFGGSQTSPFDANEGVPAESEPSEAESPFVDVFAAAQNAGTATVTSARAPANSSARIDGAADQFAGYSSLQKRQSSARIREVLAQSSPELDFPGDVPLTEVLQTIEDYVKSESGLPLTIIPDRRELDQEGISSLDDITVFDLQLGPEITLHSALELILAQTDELDYVIKNEVMMITTRMAAEQDAYMETRLYDVTQLLPMFRTTTVRKPLMDIGVGLQGGGLGGGAGMFQVATVAEFDAAGQPDSGGGGGQQTVNYIEEEILPIEQLIEMIQSISSPPATWLDIDGEGGRITATETHLVVRQSRRGHEIVVDVLEQLHETAGL